MGCPDTGCPIVCGTPGSLADYYGKLVSLVFGASRGILVQMVFVTSGGHYDELEKHLLLAVRKSSEAVKVQDPWDKPKNGHRAPNSRLFAHKLTRHIARSSETSILTLDGSQKMMRSW